MGFTDVAYNVCQREKQTSHIKQYLILHVLYIDSELNKNDKYITNFMMILKNTSQHSSQEHHTREKQKQISCLVSKKQNIKNEWRYHMAT